MAGGSQGPNLVGAGANVAGANVDWQTPGNVTADDATYVIADLTTGTDTDYLAATSLGFAIPADATIVGIVVEIDDYLNNEDV